MSNRLSPETENALWKIRSSFGDCTVPPMGPLAAPSAAAAGGRGAAAPVDGDAALRHASALASAGPRPWGSPRARAGAAYVAAQLRSTGLSGVRQEDFEVKAVRGVNVVAVLKGAGPGIVVVGAHHDTPPDA